MFLSIETQRDQDFAEYSARYEADRRRAIDGMTCFCRCGCQLPVEALGPFGTPARCPDCRHGDKHEHYLTPRAVETFDWAKYEPPPPVKPTPRHRAPLSWERRQEAEAYVRKAGRRGFKAIARMHTRLVEAGRSLTDAQAEAALRSKAADERAEESAFERSQKSERRASRSMDINRVVIGPEISAGKYAVRDDDGWFVRLTVSRPSGQMRGFVMVTLTYGDGIERTGGQYPGPGQTYRGEGAHLVARLVSNPDAARALLEEAEAVEAA